MERNRMPLHVEPLEGGAVWDVVFGGSRGNILDRALVEALTSVFDEAEGSPALKAVRLRGQGSHFSFGASIPDHLPGEVDKMLPSFHRMFRSILNSSVVYLAAIRGSCLGGGLELASFCHRVFASPDAKLGQPEIVLGVFAPVSSLVLADRVGRASAEDLCITGRSIPAAEALRIGLVDVVDDEPEKAALDYARQHLLSRSASSLRFAVRAVRFRLQKRLEEELEAVERLYLDELMASEDATEGIEAFLEKRQPRWRNG